MRKQRGISGGDNSDVPLPKKAQSRLVQSTGRSSKSGSTLLVQQKLLPPGPPRSIAGINATVGNGSSRGSFCLSSSSMGVGVRRFGTSRVLVIGNGKMKANCFFFFLS